MSAAVQRNADYWRGRAQAVEGAAHAEAGAYADRLAAEYRRYRARVEHDTTAWYERIAKNNEITLAEARKLLDADELEEFHWDVQEYVRRGIENAVDQRWAKQLENASAKVHISRLDAQKLRMQQEVEELAARMEKGVGSLGGRVYREAFGRTAFEVQRGIGVGWALDGSHIDRIAKVVRRPWTTDGKTFSDRIWDRKVDLLDRLHTDLVQSLMRGENPNRLAAALGKDFDVSSNAARRLVMTESAYFASAAQRDSYRELGVDKYEIVATLDSHTSETCRSLDGKVFDMTVYEPGATAPPFHPFCRTATAPWFPDGDDLFEPGGRAARGEDGKTYHVPADMTYAEWEKAFALGGDAEKQRFSLLTDDDSIGRYSLSDNAKDAIMNIEKARTQKGLAQHFKDRYGVELDPTLMRKDFDKAKAFVSGIAQVFEDFPHVSENVSDISYRPGNRAIAQFTFGGMNPKGAISLTPTGMIHCAASELRQAGIHEALHALDYRMSINKMGEYATVWSKTIVDGALKDLGIRRNSKIADKLIGYFFGLNYKDMAEPCERFAYALSSEMSGKGNKLSRAMLKLLNERYEV